MAMYHKCKAVLILQLELIIQMTARKENYSIQNNVTVCQSLWFGSYDTMRFKSYRC